MAKAAFGSDIAVEMRMGLFSKDIKTMDDLLLNGLQDIYYAEHLTTNLNGGKAANTKLNTVALRKGVNRKAAS